MTAQGVETANFKGHPAKDRKISRVGRYAKNVPFSEVLQDYHVDKES